MQCECHWMGGPYAGRAPHRAYECTSRCGSPVPEKTPLLLWFHWPHHLLWHRLPQQLPAVLSALGGAISLSIGHLGVSNLGFSLHGGETSNTNTPQKKEKTNNTKTEACKQKKKCFTSQHAYWFLTDDAQMLHTGCAVDT